MMTIFSIVFKLPCLLGVLSQITGEKEICVPVSKLKLRVKNSIGGGDFKTTSLADYIRAMSVRNSIRGNYFNIHVNATVTETVTGTARNNSGRISCTRYNPFSVEIHKDDNTFRPGMSMAFTVRTIQTTIAIAKPMWLSMSANLSMTHTHTDMPSYIHAHLSQRPTIPSVRALSCLLLVLT